MYISSVDKFPITFWRKYFSGYEILFLISTDYLCSNIRSTQYRCSRIHGQLSTWLVVKDFMYGSTSNLQLFLVYNTSFQNSVTRLENSWPALQCTLYEYELFSLRSSVKIKRFGSEIRCKVRFTTTNNKQTAAIGLYLSIRFIFLRVFKAFSH